MRRTRSDVVFDVVNVFFLTLFLLVVLYPLYFVVIASISDPALVSAGKVTFAPVGINLDGYRRIFADDMIARGYLNSLIYTVLGTLLSTALTMPFGYALSRKDLFAGKLILGVVLFTMFFSGGMIPTYLLVKSLGMIDTRWAIIIPTAVGVWQVIIARTFFKSTLPLDILESARIDGADDFAFFFRIALPLSKALMAIIVLFYSIRYWNDFFQAQLYLRGTRLYPLQLVLRNLLIANQISMSMLSDTADVSRRLMLGGLIKYGVIVVGSVPLLVLYPFLQRYFVKGILIGSLKG
jgi:putative aldouronate transport system permease protein